MIKPKKIEFRDALNLLFCPFCGEDISNKKLQEDSLHLVKREGDTFIIDCPTHKKEAKVKDC